MRPTNYDMYIKYVKSWLATHFTPEQLRDAKRVARKDLPHMPFIEYVIEYGIYGMAPACYAEWLDNEYVYDTHEED